MSRGHAGHADAKIVMSTSVILNMLLLTYQSPSKTNLNLNIWARPDKHLGPKLGRHGRRISLLLQNYEFC